jgi:tol-pal system protein YbgF
VIDGTQQLDPQIDDGSLVPEQVETASLGESAIDPNVAPEELYERSYESMLRKRFGEAEAGFRTFVIRYREHELAGNAQYWLGETYYAQSNYKSAAQAFLTGYQSYPTGRKAPDSLLKLGMSLKQLGQKEQACTAYATVEVKFPKAAEARKRAQNEAAKTGC